MRMPRFLLPMIGVLSLGVFPLFAQRPTVVTAKLTAPISTKTSRQGDRITALVETPKELEGGVLEGQVTKVKAPQRGLGKGKAGNCLSVRKLDAKGSQFPRQRESDRRHQFQRRKQRG